MHNFASHYTPSHNLYDNSVDLKQRPFMKTLFKIGAEKCVEYLGSDIKSNLDDYKFCRK